MVAASPYGHNLSHHHIIIITNESDHEGGEAEVSQTAGDDEWLMGLIQHFKGKSYA